MPPAVLEKALPAVFKRRFDIANVDSQQVMSETRKWPKKGSLGTPWWHLQVTSGSNLAMRLTQPILRRHRGYTGARLEQMKKAASLCLEGATIPEIAEELNISESTVRRLLKASEGLPTRHLSETAQVARLMELRRTELVMREFFPIARREKIAGVEPSFNDSLEAAKIILSTIDLRMKLLGYEETPAINYRKLQADVRRLLSK